jgi:hypothetical protein
VLSRHRHLHPKSVVRMFEVWETYDLNGILNCKFPNLSVTHYYRGDANWFLNFDQDYVSDVLGVNIEAANEEEYVGNFPDPRKIVKNYRVMIRSLLSCSEIVPHYINGSSNISQAISRCGVYDSVLLSVLTKSAS